MVKKTNNVLEIEKVKYIINHQAIVDCPRCGHTDIIDLGEDALVELIKIDCQCGFIFILSEINDV